jgi:hypothetical protein
MPKAVKIGEVAVPGATTFTANVAPDPFDARDLLYRPRIQMLKDKVDCRPDDEERYVMLQDGSSCTGHAVAAMINTVLAEKAGKPPYDRVSPYMLYYLARRYDEFSGEDDLGSSLRGVLKGWWRHGVPLEHEWPKLKSHFDLDDRKLVESCRQRPLGAFYRVDTQRLDDMQSAISELRAIVASGSVHDGWRDPVKEDENFVIRKNPDSKPLGGHAFALVGYNAIGFLVQNSWGRKWGKGGFATLPYEDWLDCAYDAWVARPGVPQTPFERVQRSLTTAGTIGVSAAPPPDVVRKHVLNVGNEGRLSQSGQSTSSPAQLRELIDEMKAKHTAWGTRDAVIYIHGGLNSESSGLSQVQEQFQWWMNNHVYPIFIVWESGALDVLMDQVADLAHAPFGAGFSFIEAIDRAVERICSNVIPFGWSQMKDNAGKACRPLANVPKNDADWFDVPGASLLMRLLEKYKAANGGLNLHLLVHSAGAVYADSMLPRLEEYGLTVESLTLMASAARIDSFDATVVGRLGKFVKRLTSFTMNDTFELDDTCGPVYHKSLLYLVSRGFERPPKREVPLVGMEHFFDEKLKSGKTLRDTIGTGSIVVSSQSRPAGAHDDSVSTAKSHGSFHNDEPTMTAVLLRILGVRDVTNDVQRYKKNTAPVALAPLAAGARIPIKQVERRKTKRSGTKKSQAPEKSGRRFR